MKKNVKTRFFLPGKLHKLLLTMKMTAILVLLTSLQISASVYSQNTTFKMNLQGQSLIDVMKEIRRTSEFTFVYDLEDVEGVNNISVNSENASIEEVLDECLEGSNLTYEIIDRVVVLKQKPDVASKPIQQEKKEIEGTVTDKDGNTLPGVSVVVKGTTNGVATDINGNYTIQIEGDSAVLIFSFVGMLSQEMAYNGQADLNVVLKFDTANLDEVIVTGYQTISKERATGSFSTITNETLENKMHSDLTKSIEGMTTGLVTDNNGNITIRGASTFEAEVEPLIVLDGFPYDGNLRDINPDNIENITVLKDGVAASIYGARSANGVIVVTTKRGKKGEFKLSYKSTFSTTQKTDFSDLNRSSSNDYINGQIALFDSAPVNYQLNERFRPRVDYLLMQARDGVITRAEAEAEIDQYRNVDTYSQIEKYGLRNKFTQQHNLTISGGGEKNLFNASLNYYDAKGEELLSKNSRFIFDVKNTWKPKEYITFSTSVNIVYRKGEGSTTSMLNLVQPQRGIQPYDPIVDANGNPVEVDYYVSPYKVARYESRSGMKPWGYNPLEDMKTGMKNSNDYQSRLSANLNVDITKGLDVAIGGTWTRGNSLSKRSYSADSHLLRIGYNDASSVSDPSKHYLPEGGLLDETRSINESYNLRTQINFNRSFNGDKHRVRALVGNEIRREQFDRAQLPTKIGYQPISGDYKFIDNAMFLADNGGDFLFGKRNSSIPNLSIGELKYMDNRYVSWYGNASYEFDNRFIVSGSSRLDLTNFFGTSPKYRYKPTWSVGGTYKMANEKWFEIDKIDRLNLRASYGINGNISLESGPFMTLRSKGYSIIAEDFAYAVNSPANNELRWEKTLVTNLGFDISAFNSRLNLSLDLYKKESSDLLSPNIVDQTTGVNTVLKNQGEISNKGIELSINADVIRGDDFSYNTMLNISYNKSMVEKYEVNNPYFQYTNDQVPYETGYPAQSIWGFKGAPLSELGSGQAYNADGEIVSLSNLGKDDVINLGSRIPTTTMAWSNSLIYKNFEASFMFVGSFGAKLRQDAFTGRNIENKHVAEAWQNPGDEAKTIYPKISYDAERMYQNVDYFIQSADFVKLREVTISYNLPSNLLNTIGFSRGRVFMQGRNLFTIKSKRVEIDPETKGMPLKIELYTGLSFEF